MKDKFNQQVGVSPEQSRAALMGETPSTQQTMVEQEQLVPTLTPHGVEADLVNRQMHQQRLAQDKQQAKRVQQYQVKITTIHSRLSINGKLVKEDMKRYVEPINRSRQLTNDFNQETAQAYDLKTLDLSPSW